MRGEDVQLFKNFFFDAMRQGWTAGTEKETIPQMPGVKTIAYREEDLYLLDYYFVDKQTGRSAGSTVIWFRDKPVWIMHYGGWYEERVIPFLKEALITAYQDRIFYGGRGPLVFQNKEKSLMYVNRGVFDQFEEFDGREEIYDANRIITLGWHQYWGLLLRR